MCRETVMKTLRVQDEVHEKLTTLVGELTAQSGKLQTYADALMRLIETSVILPDELISEINELTKKRKDLGTQRRQTSCVTLFVVDWRS